MRMKFKTMFVGLVMGLAGLLATHPAVAAPPVVSSITPAKGGTAGGVMVDILGANLGGVTAVTFGGTAAQILMGSPTQIRVVAPAREAGAAAVAVTTSEGTATGPKYTYEAPSPVVSSISPARGDTAGGTAVDINGVNLGGATAVTFGGTAARIVTVSPSHIRVMTPAGSVGVVAVEVTTPGGKTSGPRYTYAASPPVISGVTPIQGGAAGGAAVDISGVNLGGVTAVTFGGTAARILTGSQTQIRVITPARPAGAAAVTVVTPGGKATGPNYTYVAPLPTISTIAPVVGGAAGGTAVDIAGANLGDTSAVTFGGRAAQIVGKSATYLRVLTPAHPTGTVPVEVMTSGGKAAAPKFTFR